MWRRALFVIAAALGIGESLTRAPGRPFDCALFELVLEPLEAPDPRPARRETALRVW